MMKLSTKTLFTSIKNSPKRKFKEIKQQKSSNIEGLKNSSKSNNLYFDRNESNNLFITKTIVNENPFRKPRITIRRIKSKKLRKIMSYNIKEKKIVKEDALIEDSYFNNISITTESEFNEYGPKNGNIDINHINNVEQNDLFRKSNIKTKYIIYNKKYYIIGLSPKNKIIDNSNKRNGYSSNKSKNKIKKNLFGNNNEKKQNKDNYDFKIDKSNKNTNKIKTNIIHNNLLLKKEKNEIESNFIFETFSNNSYDSSFLSSNPFS